MASGPASRAENSPGLPSRASTSSPVSSDRAGKPVWADAHRAFAASAAEKLGQELGRIWYAGHWGWHFYAEREGFRQLHAEGPFPAPGELLLWPKFGDVGRVRMSEIMPRFQLLYTISYDATLPLRTVGRGANFYLADARSGRRPHLPFRVRRSGPVQRFHVMRLQP